MSKFIQRAVETEPFITLETDGGQSACIKIALQGETASDRLWPLYEALLQDIKSTQRRNP